MLVTHPTCTELAAWRPGDTDSGVARHLSECVRCRSLHAMLEAEGAELERTAPGKDFLARVAALGTRPLGELASPARRAGDMPTTDHPPAVEQRELQIQAALSRAVEELTFDPANGFIWLKLPQGRMCLGDLHDLRAYLEGAWFEAWYSGAGADPPQAALERAARRDIERALERLRPQLETLGWLETRAAEPRRLPAWRWKKGRSSNRARWQATPWRAATLRASLLVVPLAVVLLVVRSAVLGPAAPGAPPHPALNPLPSSAEDPSLTAKGSKGLPPLSVIVKRGEALIEYDDRLVVMPGDRLRLRFRLDAPGKVLAGILTDSGAWVPFFEDHFKAGEHLPTATLLVDDRPGSGRVLLGEPRAVRAAVQGAPEENLHAIELVWQPAPTRTK